jgi:two-component system CheB/CheR fusion protein
LEKIEKKQSPPGSPSHYVGIGASAGGLEAIEAFVTNMPSQSNLAFIIIQHLSPDYKSLMVELLAKKTEMGVYRAEEGMEVLAGNIYLIPPKKNLTIFHGKLLLKDKTPQEGLSLPIDIFLQSLAEDQAERAIAVILSGTGSDGARGIRAIKEHNGMVMVQDEVSAKFDGMPRAAISTGAADYVLSPDRMPEQLLAYVAHPYISGKKKASSLLEDADSLTRLFAELRAKTKVDFTHYKPTTISRRIERRMTVNQINDFDEYVRYLTSFPGEVMALYREMLIGVTSFFRDPEAMEELGDKYLPGLFKHIKKRELRLWVAGCSTGEEAYTLAIMCKELMEKEKISCDVKIFATDIDRDAIVKASTGVYSESIAADLPPNLLSKYFYRKEDSYQIARVIREMVVFAQHNLIHDPPFTNIDLISCRNLLIYLQPVLQVKALTMFNFSLNSHGILFLGKSETVGEMSEYFKPLHQRYKIYESLGKNFPLPEKLQIKGARTARAVNYDNGSRRPNRRSGDRESFILKSFVDLVSKKYIPLAVIVNEQLDIQQIIGDTTGFFTIPSGPIEFNISKLATRDLAIPLATGIQKVFRTEEEVTYSSIHLDRQPHKITIRLHIQPLPKKRGHENMAVVFFEEMTPPSSSKTSKDEIYSVSEEAQQRIDDLEQELQFARENLQATIEELETSNEELQATNEELLASNEELQSTNEELQSTNEELYTVNAEHQNKIIELTELTNDVDNLLTSSKIGTLIVDENLEIRKYSPEIKNIFNILEKDVGRPFSHISSVLVDFDPVAEVGKVQKSNRPTEIEVRTKDGKRYLTRIMPYHIGPEMYSGVVLTFVDISELNVVKHKLRKSQKTDQHIRDNIPVGLMVYQQNDDGSLFLAECNPEAQKLTGVSMNLFGGKTLKDIWPQVKETKQIQELMGLSKTGATCVLDDIEFSNNGYQSVFHIHAFRLPDNKLAISFEDQTHYHSYQKHLINSGERLDMLIRATNLPWWEWKIPEGLVILSKQMAELTGGNADKEGSHIDVWSKIIHPDDYDRVLTARDNYTRENGESYEISYRLRQKSNGFLEVTERGEISGWDENLQARRFIGVLTRISAVQEQSEE